MKEKSRKMALCGVLCALSTVCMLLGGIIPFATFCCPALAAALLTPLLFEAGDKMTLAAYAAVAVLSLLLCPDREAALIFAFSAIIPCSSRASTGSAAGPCGCSASSGCSTSPRRRCLC